MQTEPTTEQTAAARLALSLTNDELAHALLIAAVPSSPTSSPVRAAMMAEAAARLSRDFQSWRPRRPLWIERYNQARQNGQEVTA